MKSESPKAVYLTWNDSRRSESLTTFLGLKRVVYVGTRRGPFRHILGALESVLFLARERPKLIWYQFSFLLGLTLAAYAHLMGKGRIRLVADVFPQALRREGPPILRALVVPLKRWALATSNQVIVTHPVHAAYAKAHLAITPLTISDPLPNVPACSHPSGTGRVFDVVFVCSFCRDEPVSLILEVCKRISPTLSVAVTGDADLLNGKVRNALRKMATLTGYLTGDEYWDVLHRTRCIVDLSCDPASLPCGAYEAIALGRKPLLPLDAEVVVFFGTSAVYTPLNPDDLHKTILRMLADGLSGGNLSIAQHYKELWEAQWLHVRQVLEGSGCLPTSDSRSKFLNSALPRSA